MPNHNVKTSSSLLNAADTSIDRVEWSRSTILGFIEDYRRQRVLWDPNTKGYHIKQVKYEALKLLGHKYRTEIRSIRSKIKSLRSSFHREHGKVINGQRRGIHYQPMWFAYEAIRFILDGEPQQPPMTDDAENNEVKREAARSNGDEIVQGEEHADGAEVVAAEADSEAEAVTQGLTKAGAAHYNAGCAGNSVAVAVDEQAVKRADFDSDMNQYCNISAEDVKTELLESDSADLQSTADKSQSPLSYLSLAAISTSRKRKRTQQSEISPGNRHNHSDAAPQPKMQHNNSIARSQEQTSTTTTTTATGGKFSGGQSDEYSVFGEYVAITIRKLKTSKAKIVVKHLINNLLYEAELGKYDYGIPASKEPPQLYKT